MATNPIQLEAVRRYKAAHPDKVREWGRGYAKRHAEDMANRKRRWLSAHPDAGHRWYEKRKEQHHASVMVYRAVDAGVLVKPGFCELCPSTKVEAHHDDYSKPLEVRWLCHKCHSLLRRVSV